MRSHCRFRNVGNTYSEWCSKQLILAISCELGGEVEARALHCSTRDLAENFCVSHHLTLDNPVLFVCFCFCWPCCPLSSLNNAV